ncbi:putative lipoprotein LppU [Mycobacterium xenopi 4042]|uniref:Putative lipoprotein LppU n=1 Tax=Mycobacterium xenopi 4042 TaxID=1299334 RepID=X8CHT1_MYCXE|nr:putative lipoprotein LppU [Mycobacterium xenopi 4042]
MACGSRASNFKVAATVVARDQCPGDVDSAYSMRNGFSETRTACLDIDWVVGECMSVDPPTAPTRSGWTATTNPCRIASAPPRFSPV